MPNTQLTDIERARAAAAPKPPSDEDLRADLERERAARAAAERDREQLQMAAHNEWQGRTRAEQELQRLRQPQADPFNTLAQEGVGLDPDKQAALLDAGARQRAREEVGAGLSAYERQRMARDYERDTQNALTIFTALNPEIAGDEEGFYAAMSKASLRAKKQNLRMNQSEMLNYGKTIYLEDRNRAGLAAPVPYTESQGLPGGLGGRKEAKDEPRVQNLLEQIYGLEPGEIHEDGGEYSLDNLTEDYIDTKNEALEKEGFGSKIRQVRGTMLEGRARKQRRANAAGR